MTTAWQSTERNRETGLEAILTENRESSTAVGTSAQSKLLKSHGQNQMPDVYFIANCRWVELLPKDKYVAICCFAPNPCGLFINSRINEFIQQNPKLLDCETPLPVCTARILAA